MEKCCRDSDELWREGMIPEQEAGIHRDPRGQCVPLPRLLMVVTIWGNHFSLWRLDSWHPKDNTTCPAARTGTVVRWCAVDPRQCTEAGGRMLPACLQLDFSGLRMVKASPGAGGWDSRHDPHTVWL